MANSREDRVRLNNGNYVRTTFFFDALNPLLSRNFTDGTKEEFQYDAVGQTIMTKNTTVEQRYTRDALNRVTDHRYVTFNKTLKYGWDAVGNRTKLTYSDGNVMAYSFDAANQLVQATDTKAGTFLLAYDLTGHRTSLAFPNGLTTAYNYDVRDRVLSIVTTGEKGQSAAVQAPDFFYEYNSVGNRTFMNRTDEGRTDYQYDSSDELTKASFPNGGFQEFTYDLAGNRQKLLERENGQLHTTNYEYDSGNELVRLIRDFREKGAAPNALMVGPGAPTSVTYFVTSFTFDGNGCRTMKVPDDSPATTYTWDTQERLLAVADDRKTIQTADYDLFARRTTLTAGSASSRFLYDGAQINNRYFEELSIKENSSGSRELWLGASLVGEIIGGEAVYLIADALGSVEAKLGSNGVLLQRDSYKPFGEVKQVLADVPFSNLAGFVGAQGVQSGGVSSLEYMWYRYYEPMDGCFLSRDFEEMTYTYANNNPINMIDPLGLDEVDASPEDVAEAAANFEAKNKAWKDGSGSKADRDAALRNYNEVKRRRSRKAHGADTKPKNCTATEAQKALEAAAAMAAALEAAAEAAAAAAAAAL